MNERKPPAGEMMYRKLDFEYRYLYILATYPFGMRSTMPFREKSAWVTLAAILLVSVLFVLHAPRLSHPRPGDFHALLACIVAFVVIEIAAFLVLRLRYPEDARTPIDEREQLINLKATYLASRCYVIGSFLAVVTLHLGASAVMIGYFVVLAFVIAEIVKYGARIIYYRRGV